MRSVGAGLLLLLASALPASAEQLIIALSTNNIRIDSGFTGDARHAGWDPSRPAQV